MNAYTTVKQAAETEYVEKRSRFLGAAFSVKTEAETALILSQRRGKYWDASHNCYAYILKSGAQRYSDDGEPQGTAGIPILEVLKREEVVDALIIITRYFGGTLLGAGGLARAYSHTAKLALTAAGTVVMQPCVLLRLNLPYTLYNRADALLERHGALILNSDFGESVTLTLRLPSAGLPLFSQDLTEFSSGQASAEVIGEEFA